MKNNQQLINNIIGQLNGIGRMLDEKKECQQVLIQLKAIKSALNSLTNKIIEDNSSQCLKNISPKNKKDLQVLLKELINNN